MFSTEPKKTKSYLEMAKEAIAQVKNIQSANTWGAVLTDKLGMTSYGSAVANTQAQRGASHYGDPHYLVEKYAAVVKATRAGNCADKTDVAFDYLIKTYGQIVVLTKCSSVGYDHAFLIIHNGEKINIWPGNEYNRSVFGMDAVLVDAWQHDYYKLNGSPSMSISAWMVTPQQLKTRYKISTRNIHPLMGNEVV